MKNFISLKKLSGLRCCRRLFILITFFFAFSAQAQMVYLPDTNFRNKLINLGYGVCIIGDSIDSSCPQVANTTSLNVSSFNIHDLQGVQAFGLLTYLNCNGNQLTVLPALQTTLNYLNCGANTSLINLPALPPSLDTLICSGTPLPTLPTL